MGAVVERERLADRGAAFSGLLVYCNESLKTQEAKSIGKPLAEALLKCKPNRRSMKLERIFYATLSQYSDGAVIKDIDVMFHPGYQVDVLKILIAARKRKPYSLIWPGRHMDGKLIYGEEGYLDYKVYKIADYDIICVK